MKTYLGRGTDERGAILVQVAISILTLTALSAFVVDQGVLLVARNQAQTAADAGALAGAIALAYDETTYPPTSTGMAFQSAQKAAYCASGSSSCPATPLAANPVWPSQAGASSAVNVTWTCPPGSTGKCVQVNVYRDGQANGSTPLPVFFGPLLGVTSQGIRATASAMVFSGNAVDCLRPFALADKWTDTVPGPSHPSTVDDTYTHWSKTANNVIETNPHDIYTPPDASGPGSGYTLTNDLGTQRVIKIGNQSQIDKLSGGWYFITDLPDSSGVYDTGGKDYRNTIPTCYGGTVHIGQYLPVETGAKAGPTQQGTQALIDQDPNARWDTSTNTVTNSCAPSCAPYSPRIIPVAVFDIEDYQHRTVTSDNTPCPVGSGSCIKITNILGFFIDIVAGSGDVTGRLVRTPGVFISGDSTVGGTGAFLTNIQLVR